MDTMCGRNIPAHFPFHEANSFKDYNTFGKEALASDELKCQSLKRWQVFAASK